MATYNYDQILKLYTGGLSQADLKELFVEAAGKQRNRGDSASEGLVQADLQDFSEAELLLKIVANLIEADVTVPGFLKYWLKEILDAVAAGEDPRAIAFTAKSSVKGHRVSHDNEFIKHGTTVNYRIAAIVQLLELAAVKRAKAVRIVTDAVFSPMASEQAVRRAIAEWADLGFSNSNDPNYLRFVARGNEEGKGDEFSKVVQHVQKLSLDHALRTLLGN